MGELLSVEDVQKGLSRGGRWTAVLSGVSLEVDPGEIVAVLGSRLEGKTTLLKVAAGLERPDEGRVSLGGRDLTDLGDRDLARLLGREIMWIDRVGPGLGVKVSRFVGWPLALNGRERRRAEQMAAAALARVGAGECAERRWGELSLWQQALVGLARAFVGTPRLVVIDDLLDALGTRRTEEAADLLRALVEESEAPCGVLMSASEMESAVFANRVFSLTRKGALKCVAGHRTGDAEVIPFPQWDVRADGA